MATKDISAVQVCASVEKMHSLKTPVGSRFQVSVELLMAETGESRKVCMSAIERDISRGLVEWGIVHSVGWLTDEGKAYLIASRY